MSENETYSLEVFRGEALLSLWPSLHDARLERITSSRIEGTIRLTVDIPHLREFHQMQAESRFEVHCLGAEWARAGEAVPWPGNPPPSPAGSELRAAHDWDAEWQGATVSWEQFEQALAAEPWGPAWVFEAMLERLGESGLALRLGFQMNEDFWPGLYVRCSRLEIRGQDGRPWSLAEFLDLGLDYWEDFAQRSQAVREASIPR